MSAFLTAAQAADTLGISLPTLYSYVSRGLLQSTADGNNRRRLYPAAEVRRLARRKADGKRAGKVAQRVLDWGVPVLESRITLISNGRLFYRGHDAMELARSATLEETAALLWECERADVDASGALEAASRCWEAWLRQTRANAPHEQSALQRIDAIVQAAGHATGHAPTVDFALSSIERVLGLPAGAAFALFALGRATGWIAHAMEQMEDGRLIRPRARYVGVDVAL